MVLGDRIDLPQPLLVKEGITRGLYDKDFQQVGGDDKAKEVKEEYASG